MEDVDVGVCTVLDDEEGMGTRPDEDDGGTSTI